MSSGQFTFTQIAYGSLMEVACQLEIASDMGFLSLACVTQQKEAIALLAKKLCALRTAQLRRESSR